jgi:Zn-dependent peptidase ImmA (M78 family)
VEVDPWWKAEARATEVLRQLKVTSLPVDPFRIAAIKDILCEEKTSLEEGISGCLMRVGDVFGIIYSGRFQSPGYRKFTVGHELGHYFLDGHVDHLFRDGQSAHVSASGFVSDDRYEREADAFAAALLMPKELFSKACVQFQTGMNSVLALSELFEMSLTSTAIRYARLSRDPVAVVLSAQQRVIFSIMSPTFRAHRGLSWLKKGMAVPQDTPTFSFALNAMNIAQSRSVEGVSSLEDWFDGTDHELSEEVIGLGSYGRVLTVLSTESLPESEDNVSRSDGRTDDEAEDLLPSERFFRKTRY